MNRTTFADQLVDITVTGPLVRLDFASLSIAERDEAGQAKLDICERLIMQIDNFLRAYEAMGRMIALMVDKGTLTRQPPSSS